MGCLIINGFTISFKLFRSQKALTFTNNKGVEPAMEWLLAHSDENELVPSVVSTTDTAGTSSSSTPIASEDGPAADVESNEADAAPEAKSFKCDEWYVSIAWQLVFVSLKKHMHFVKINFVRQQSPVQKSN